MQDLGGYPGMGGVSDYPGSSAMLPENPPALDPEVIPAAAPAPIARSGDTRSTARMPAASPESAGVDGRGRVLTLERTPASEDTDTLTRETIAKMCEYIRAGVHDPNICYCMSAAVRKLGLGRSDPFSLCWSAFWFLKHRVKRANDEAALFRLGEPDQADMLIAPAVLIQMTDAAEDCDGFTMLAAAMLGACGVEQCIVTIACDARDRTRWSHVFGMVRMPNGDWLPLDCSHGPGPGWMVPRQQIYRWQAWDLDGNPIDAAPPVRSRLRGYVFRGRGMGDASCPSAEQLAGIEDASDPCQSGVDITSPDLPTTAPITPWGTPASPTTPATSSFDWATFLAGLTGSAAKVATVAELPAGSTLLPNGTIVGAGQAIPGLGISSSSLLLIGGVALAGLVLFSVMGKGSR